MCLILLTLVLVAQIFSAQKSKNVFLKRWFFQTLFAEIGINFISHIKLKAIFNCWTNMQLSVKICTDIECFSIVPDMNPLGSIYFRAAESGSIIIVCWPFWWSSPWSDEIYNLLIFNFLKFKDVLFCLRCLICPAQLDLCRLTFWGDLDRLTCLI